MGDPVGSEATENSSSSDDEFFRPDAAPNDIFIGDLGRSEDERLAKEQILKRRLDSVSQLSALYEAQLHASLAELHARRDAFHRAGSFSGKETAQGAQAGEPPEPGAAATDTEMEWEAQPSAEAEPQAATEQQQAPGLQTQHTAGLLRAEQGEPLTFTDAEEAIMAAPSAGPDTGTLAALRQGTRASISRICRLEQAASAGTARALDRAGALAALCGRRTHFLIKRSAVTLGRAASAQGQVDVDLSREGSASRVSRQQARLSLQPDGAFRVHNTGRRRMRVNNVKVEHGQSAVVPHLSLLEMGGISLLFHVNHAAVRRLVARSATFGDFGNT